MTSLFGIRGFPPIRQKRGEWMGHGRMCASLSGVRVASPCRMAAKLMGNEQFSIN